MQLWRKDILFLMMEKTDTMLIKVAMRYWGSFFNLGFSLYFLFLYSFVDSRLSWYFFFITEFFIYFLQSFKSYFLHVMHNFLQGAEFGCKESFDNYHNTLILCNYLVMTKFPIFAELLYLQFIYCHFHFCCMN